MCGIAGTVRWGDDAALKRMADVQCHRGPDDSGVWRNTDSTASAGSAGSVAFASRRLAILDLSPAGHMPMGTPEGDLWITYNGEVYNFRALRAELEALGHRFRSETDTEVVLALYRQYGPECVKRLNGMFAFAIWDAKRQRLFLARDHFGVKPLYYAQRGERFAFASEAKALFQLPELRASVDPAALHQYMTFLWVPDPGTIFAGVKKLPAGHYALFADGRLAVHQYWDLEFPPAGTTYHRDERSLAGELRERLARAVRAQMVSDVPVGAFLSAGIDSTTITAFMSEASASPVSTYTISFPPETARSAIMLDDPAIARRTAARYGCRHHDIVVDPDVAALLPQIVWHLDDPVADPAAIMAFLVSREARPTTTVLLSGIGGDELFAGYRKYRAHQLAQRYRRLPAALRRGLLEPLLRAAPPLAGTPLAPSLRLARKMARSGSLPDRERFIMDGVYLDGVETGALYQDGLAEAVADSDPWSSHLAHFGRVAHADFLHQMLYVDIKTFMLSLNLVYGDKMSMASSVEARVPFLDWELAEFAAREVPPWLKLRGGTTKYVLREAVKDLLPVEVMHARKAGFGAPIDHWLRTRLKPMAQDLLAPDAVARRGYFRPARVSQMLAEHFSGRRDWSLPIWQLLTLELWLQAFVDSPAPAVAA